LAAVFGEPLRLRAYPERFSGPRRGAGNPASEQRPFTGKVNVRAKGPLEARRSAAKAFRKYPQRGTRTGLDSSALLDSVLVCRVRASDERFSEIEAPCAIVEQAL
jgi:hypothetical protein